MKSITDLAKIGTEEERHNIGNGFELGTQYIIVKRNITMPQTCKPLPITEMYIECATYKNGERTVNPDELSEVEFTDEQFENMEEIITKMQMEDNTIGIVEKGEFEKELTPKTIWYAIGDTYEIKDQLKANRMEWDSDLKTWKKEIKPEVQGVEFVCIKTYK
jgi:hypothetical protein